MSQWHNRKLLEAYKNGVCMRCGGNCSDDSHMHHKNHDDRDDRTDNLLYLCRKCHTAVHKENGKSRVIPAQLIRVRGAGITRGGFDIKYENKGGSRKLEEMESEGRTLQEIGDHFGVTREYIRQLLIIFGIRESKNYIRPYEIKERPDMINRKLKNIYRWLIDNNMLIKDFSKITNINQCRLSSMLTGKVAPKVKELEIIKDITGMTFEQILSTNGDNKDISQAPAA